MSNNYWTETSSSLYKICRAQKQRKMRSTIKGVSAFGNTMTLEVVDHGDDGASKEFIVSAPKFDFKKWLFLTSLLSLLSITCEIYIVDLRLLGGILSILCCALILKLHKKIKLESLLVISSLGLQHTTLYASGRRKTFFLPHRRLKSVLIVEGISMQKILFYLAIVLNSEGPLPRRHTLTAMNSDNSPVEKSNVHNSFLANLSSASKTRDPLSRLDPNPITEVSSVSHPLNCRISTVDTVYPLFQSLWPRLDMLTVIYRGVQKTLFHNNHLTDQSVM